MASAANIKIEFADDSMVLNSVSKALQNALMSLDTLEDLKEYSVVEMALLVAAEALHYKYRWINVEHIKKDNVLQLKIRDGKRAYFNGLMSNGTMEDHLRNEFVNVKEKLKLILEAETFEKIGKEMTEVLRNTRISSVAMATPRQTSKGAINRYIEDGGKANINEKDVVNLAKPAADPGLACNLFVGPDSEVKMTSEGVVNLVGGVSADDIDAATSRMNSRRSAEAGSTESGSNRKRRSRHGEGSSEQPSESKRPKRGNRLDNTDGIIITVKGKSLSRHFKKKFSETATVKDLQDALSKAEGNKSFELQGDKGNPYHPDLTLHDANITAETKIMAVEVEEVHCRSY